MGVISLSGWDLGLAGSLVVLLALLNARLGMGQGRDILVAGVRTTIQLLLIGLVLKALFAASHWIWVLFIACAMVLIAGREVMVRQERRFSGWWGYGVGTLSMVVSSFAVTVAFSPALKLAAVSASPSTSDA